MAQVFRDGKVHVRGAQCDNCLLSRDRLVTGERARDLISSTRETEGGSFICHKSQIVDEPEAICSAWFERFADEDRILSLAKAMDVIEYTSTTEPKGNQSWHE